MKTLRDALGPRTSTLLADSEFTARTSTYSAAPLTGIVNTPIVVKRRAEYRPLTNTNTT